jgi:energy-coupling factor transport system ATP-binding protein
MTVIMATDASEMIARHMDRVVVLNAGKLEADGTPREIFSDLPLFKKLMIRSPQVSQLAAQMQEVEKPFSSFPITIDEAKEEVIQLVSDKSGEVTVVSENHKTVEDTPTSILVENLDYIYQPLNVHAVKGVSFEIKKGEFVAVIGQNGSGKTTVLKNLLGLLRPTSGTVLVAGRDTKKTAVAEMAEHVGFVLQNPDQQLFAQTVAEEISYGPKNLGLPPEEIEKRIEETLKVVGLEGKREEFPPAMPKGDRAKVVIASALALDPEIIILDEPTTGQDYKGCHQIMQIARALHEQGRTVVFVTHHMALVAEYAKRVIVLSGGRLLLDDVTEAVFSQPEVGRQIGRAHV